jgi:copper chaperone CopZ
VTLRLDRVAWRAETGGVNAERWNAIALVVGVLALGVGAPWLVREVRSLPRGTALAARADQRIVTLEVGGMTCNGCAGVVKGGLAAMPGVAAVEVRLAQRRAYVVCERAVADTALTGAVERAGPGFLAAVVAR